MEITAAFLDEQIAGFEQQHANALEMVKLSEGALQLARFLRARLDEAALPPPAEPPAPKMGKKGRH